MKVCREMGITHKDLFRLLPAAVENRKYSVETDRIVVTGPEGCVEIQYSAEGERRIASVCFPVTALEFGFGGWTDHQVEAFMRRFDRVFHKGGG